MNDVSESRRLVRVGTYCFYEWIWFIALGFEAIEEQGERQKSLHVKFFVGKYLRRFLTLQG